MSVDAASLLLEQFDHLLNTREAVTELNHAILMLAMEGKLTHRDPGDQHASQLLADVQAEKARLGKPEFLLPIGDSEKRFELPQNWVWCKAGDLFLFTTSGSRGWAKYYSMTGPIFLRIGNLDYQTINLDLRNIQYVTPPDGAEGIRTKVQPRDILVSITGDVGMTAVIPDSFHQVAFINQHIALSRPASSISPEFLGYFLVAPNGQNQLFNSRKGIKNSLALEDISSVTIGLPPLAEQHRIVARVEGLFEQTRQLAQKLTRAQDELALLNQSALAHLLAAETPEDFAAQWDFIAEHFDSLFTESEHIAPLRQAILELAVRGKLTRREPGDEPASVLLERIRAVKAKLGKDEELPAVKESEKPFDLPDGWEWVRFGEASINRDGERVPISKEDRETRGGQYDYYGASGVIDTIDDFLFDKSLLLIGEDGANLVNRSTPIAFIAHGKYWVNNHAHVIDAIDDHILEYLEVYINAIDLKPFLTGTAQPKMNQAKMNSIVVALPPLSEQERIVTKAEQLLGRCDALEAKLQAAREERERLTAAVLAGVGGT